MTSVSGIARAGVAGLVVALGCGTDAPPPRGDAGAGFPPGLPGRIDSIATAALAAGPLAGLSIAIARQGEPVFAGSWGMADVEAGAGVDRATRYAIADITRLYTGIVAARLIDEGRLDPEATLASVLPELADAPHAAVVRVRHLLTNTSGLHDFEPEAVDAWIDDGRPVTTRQAFEAARQPPRFEPGTSWAASSTGFRLAGEAISRLEGRPYAEVLSDLVTGPLGLADTALCDARPDDPHRAVLHDVGEDGFERSALDGQAGYTSSGGLCTTVEDLVRLPGGLARSGLLSDSALARLLRPAALRGGPVIDQGFGVRLGSVDDHRVWGHAGGVGTYWAVLVHLPDDGLTVAVLQNTDGANEDALTVAGAVLRAALGLGPPTLAPVPAGDLVRFAGRYDDEGGGFDIAVVADSLVRIRGTRHALVPLGALEFGWRLFPMDRFRFHEIGGSIVGVSDYYNGLFAAYFPRLRGPDAGPTGGGEAAP